MPYLVLEIKDRDPISLSKCETLEEAIEKANELLEIHCGYIGYGEEFQNYMRTYETDPQKANEESAKIGAASKYDPDNAWCGFDDQHWDAYIVDMDAASMGTTIKYNYAALLKTEGDRSGWSWKTAEESRAGEAAAAEKPTADSRQG